MAYIDWWNRTGPATLGERFGLNEGGRIDMKPGGIVEPGMRQGFQNPGLVTQIPKIPGYIKTGKKVWNIGKRIFNQLKGSDRSKIRSNIYQAVKEDVGPGISISTIDKTGNIRYRLQLTDEVSKYSDDVSKLMLERDTLVANKLKPFRDKGFISSRDMVKLFEDRGISTSNITGDRGIHQQLSRIADDYKIEKVKVEVPTTGAGYWYKPPSKEKLTEIWQDRLTPQDRIPIAKKLIKDFKIDSFKKLNKVMKNKGYSLFKEEFMRKHFPEIKGLSFVDPKFVSLQKKFNARTVLNSIRYDLRKSMGSIPAEEFLISAKKSTGFGKLVHLMHTTTKQKKTGKLLNVTDLNFGSSLENEAYGNGLDNIRSGLTTVLKHIANLHKGKNPNTIVDVNLTLQREYNFPKTMKLKDLINRVNTGLTDLALKTNGKVRGELLEFTGNKMKFVDNPIIDYESVLGSGLVEGKFKELEPLLKKFKVHWKTSEAGKKGDLVFDKNGMPVLKKNQKLTQKEAETVVIIIENMKLQLPKAAKSKPFKGELKFVEGGRIGLQDGTTWPTKWEIAGGAAGIGTGAAITKYPEKIWEGAKKVGKYGIVKPLAALAIPFWKGVGSIKETVEAVKEKKAPDYDLDNPMTYMGAAFWNWGMKELGLEKTVKHFGESLKTLSKGDKLRVFRNTIARAGLSPKTVQFISSRLAWPIFGLTSGYKLHQWAKENLDWDPLTEEQQQDIQTRKEAVPKMLDTYEQASQIAKEQGISYEDALKLVNKPDVPGINFEDKEELSGVNLYDQLTK